MVKCPPCLFQDPFILNLKLHLDRALSFFHFFCIKSNNQYFNFSTKDTKYYGLLKKKVIDYSKYPELPQGENEEDIEKLVDLSLKINEFEDMQAEVEFGCRSEDDLLEFKVALENT